MESRTQTLLDSLTDHLALFHSPKNPTSRPNPIHRRSPVLRWLSSLPLPARCAALTILDRDLLAVLTTMLSYLHRHGHCFFFLLTDAPASAPSVLYRRSRGLLARAAAGNRAETELGESVLLLSSGEVGNRDLDTVTVSEELVSDIDRFVEVMDAISGGRFLTEEENIGAGKAEKWPELAWLKDKGYYSLESYVANRLEIALRTSWREANRGSGGRKSRNGKGIKDKSVVATSGMAANVFWREKGCFDWWTQLDQRERQKIFDAFFGKSSTTMPDITLPLQPPNSIDCDSRSVMHNLLHEEIDYFCKQVRAGNLKRKPYVTWAVNRVSRCLQVLWPRSRTSLFGSNATGLALPSSDVDLVISLPPVRNLEPIKEAGILEGRNGIKETCLQHAARHLLNQEWVRNDSLKTIENTAIPVIMLEADVPSDINLCDDNPLASDNLQEGQENMTVEQCDSTLLSEPCPNSKTRNDCVVKSIRLDISFKSSSHTGLQTSELVRELIQQFPASAPLALVLKKFLADRSLDHPYSGGLSSYCLVLLITRFLQHEHHLGQPIKQNLGSLLMDFLYFFGNVFDPRQMRISIRGSGLYMNRERGHSIDPIHIDDPLYPANNVGRNCFRIHQCIKAFADAFSLLEGEIENMSGQCSVAVSKLSLLRKIIPTIDCNE